MEFKFFSLSIIFWSAQIANAQESNQDKIALDTLGEVVVIAQRMENQLFTTPASVGILTDKNLRDRQERTVPEALMSMPGIFVQKTNHGGGSPFLRGLTGNQTLLLVDGIRLSNATFRYGPNQYLNTIDPFSIERMEIWKGGGSVPYGSDALSGTINVLTTEPNFSLSSELSGVAQLQARTQNMEKTARLQTQFSSKKWAIHLGGTLRDMGDLVGGDTTGIQYPSGYNEGAFDAKGKFLLTENGVLTVAHQFFQQTDVPVYHKIKLENFSKNHMTLQQRQLSYARFEQAMTGNSILQKITTTLSRQNTDEHRETQKNGSTTLRNESDEVTSWSVSAQLELTPGEYWRLNTGVEWYFDEVSSHRSDYNTDTGEKVEKRGLYPDGASYASSAVFCMNEWKTGSWIFNGGARYNYFSIRVNDETIGKTHLKPAAIVFNAAVLKQLSPTDNVFADFHSGFRAPNVDDLGSLGVVDFRFEVPTADLKPEKSYNFELGWRHQSKNWQTEAFVFRNELNDLIARVRVGSDSISGYPVYRKENVQKGFIHGIEMSGNILIINQLRLEGSLAWQYGQNVTDNEPLRRIPPVFGRIGLHFSHKNWQLTVENLFAGKQDRLAAGDKSDNRIPMGGTPGWSVVNAYAAYEWRWLKIRAGFWNVFNQDYRYHGSGVNGMGRNGSVGVSVHF